MPTLQEFKSSSYLNGSNAPFLELLFEQYQQDPALVNLEWRELFDEMGRTKQDQNPISDSSFTTDLALLVNRQAGLIQLIDAYRNFGFNRATIDPLKLEPLPDIPELKPEFYGLTDADLDQPFALKSPVMKAGATVRDVLVLLKQTYTGNIGSEFMHSPHKNWIQEQLEANHGHPQYSTETKRRTLVMLTAAETLEEYLHRRYPGQKRFSLQGGETLIAMLDYLIEQAGKQGVEEMVIAMAHRGRLNVLVNILGKKPRDLFREFEDSAIDPPEVISGDVKYHMGSSADVAVQTGAMHVVLACNPSHLESVNSVVLGSVRGRQDRREENRNHVIPILIHGDAAFSGQGVVMEAFNMSDTAGFTVGGTVHIVINNQIGFTTDRRDSRSTFHCTDIAKMIGAPVFHVNGDDPDSVLTVTKMALKYRMEYGKDVVIDLVCFRKLGHNEADEPAMTQPEMYKAIKLHPGTRKLYADNLIAAAVVDASEPQQMIDDYVHALDNGTATVTRAVSDFKQNFSIDWTPYMHQHWSAAVDTSVPGTELAPLAGLLTTVPVDFTPHARLEKVIADRKKMAEGILPIDWGFAENLAYATLLHDGYGVRITGQDVERGTFSHRHAVWHNQTGSQVHKPLEVIAHGGRKIAMFNSPLSEAAVLGFEYGVATAEPNYLVIWEGQFGDFANGAQVIIDQFISAGHAKWGRLCGLVMLLPHGYEGQGPEHSSARLERYLQLCAEDNIQVCVPSSPAQIFHMMRRQMLRPYRNPLIVMSPKSLLRHKEAVSTLDDLEHGNFQTVIGDNTEAATTRVIFCCGKVYYDLAQAKKEGALKHIAIVRIEQLYPFPEEEVARQIANYEMGGVKEFVWAQEEPKNQGAWWYIEHLLKDLISTGNLQYAGRTVSSAPAAGHMHTHVSEQKALVAMALGTVLPQ